MGTTYRHRRKEEENDRPDTAERRDRWHSQLIGVNTDRFVFIKNIRASIDMTRTRGHSPRGSRLTATVPQGHWNTTTVVNALRSTELTALRAVNGPITVPLVLVYVQRRLAPSLRPDDIVVMDNLAARKVAGAREAIEATGAMLGYLPPYSPTSTRWHWCFSS